MPIIIRCFSASDGHPSVGKDWQQCLSSLIMAILDTYDTLRTNLIVPRCRLKRSSTISPSWKGLSFIRSWLIISWVWWDRFTLNTNLRVYNPITGNTSLHQNSKSWNQKTNAKTLRKAKKDAKSHYARFLKWFSLRAFSPCAFALNPCTLCLGYQSVNLKDPLQRSLLAVRTIWIRRFKARPCAVPLLATGRYSP